MKLVISAKELEDRGLLGRFLKLRGWIPGHLNPSFVECMLVDYAFGTVPDAYKLAVSGILETDLTLIEEEGKSLGILAERPFIEVLKKEFECLPDISDCNDC